MNNYDPVRKKADTPGVTSFFVAFVDTKKSSFVRFVLFFVVVFFINIFAR